MYSFAYVVNKMSIGKIEPTRLASVFPIDILLLLSEELENGEKDYKITDRFQMSGDMAFILLVVLYLVERKILLFDFLECLSLLQDIFWLKGLYTHNSFICHFYAPPPKTGGVLCYPL